MIYLKIIIACAVFSILKILEQLTMKPNKFTFILIILLTDCYRIIIYLKEKWFRLGTQKNFILFGQKIVIDCENYFLISVPQYMKLDKNMIVLVFRHNLQLRIKLSRKNKLEYELNYFWRNQKQCKHDYDTLCLISAVDIIFYI